MKKVALSAVSVLMVIAMVFCLAACGGGDDQSKLEQYIKDNNLQSQMSALANEYMEVNTYAKDTSIIVDIKVTMDLDESTESLLKTQMDTAFSGMESGSKETLNDIKEKTGVASPSIVFNVNKPDGSTITSKTFN